MSGFIYHIFVIKIYLNFNNNYEEKLNLFLFVKYFNLLINKILPNLTLE